MQAVAPSDPGHHCMELTAASHSLIIRRVRCLPKSGALVRLGGRVAVFQAWPVDLASIPRFSSFCHLGRPNDSNLPSAIEHHTTCMFRERWLRQRLTVSRPEMDNHRRTACFDE